MSLVLGLVMTVMGLLTVLCSDAGALILGTAWSTGGILAFVAKSLLLILAPLVGGITALVRKRWAPAVMGCLAPLAASVTLNLRPGGRFDVVIRSFGITSFHPGTYERSGDVFRFDFAGRNPGGFAERAVSTGNAVVFDSGATDGPYALEIVAEVDSTGKALR